MIDKDYFKRQAKTLRKMVRVTNNETVAGRLSFMADDFDNRSAHSADGTGADALAPAIDPPDEPAKREDDG